MLLYPYGKPIPTNYYRGDELKPHEVNPPAIYPGQRERIHALMQNGIEVYVMTAAPRSSCEWWPRTRSTA